MLFIDRLAKVADDPIVKGADPVNIIGVGSHEDCWNRAPCIDEVSVELDSGHRRHVYVGDCEIASKRDLHLKCGA